MRNFHLPHYRRSALNYLLDRLPLKGHMNDALVAITKILKDQGASWFLLPKNGEIVRCDAARKVRVSDVRLPFDTCILEYSALPENARAELEGAPGKHVLATVLIVSKGPLMLGQDTGEDGLSLFAIWKFRWGDREVWLPGLGAIFLSAKSTVEVLSDGRIRVSEVTSYTLAGGKVSGEEIAANYLDEARVAVHFAILCACENVTSKKIFEAPSALRRKAVARGSAPVNDYWALDITLPSGVQTSVPGRGGDGKRVRLHVRRGHVRRVASGRLTWVRQCTVGDPSLGVIDKTYRVKANT